MIHFYIRIFVYLIIQLIHLKQNDMAQIASLPEHCQQPKYNGRNLTNRVIQQELKIENSKIMTYYCPVYVRTKIKNFAKMSFEDLQAEVNATLKITINFRGIMCLVQSKARQLLKVGFNRDDSIQITQDSMTVNKKTDQPGIYTYTIQKRITTAMMANVYWSPFQLIYLILSVSIPNIQMNSEIINQIITSTQQQIQKLENKSKQQGNNKQIQIVNLVGKKGESKKQQASQQDDINNQMKQLFENELKALQKIRMINIRFNFMDCQEKLAKISYSAEGTFGNYDLAESRLGVEYTFKSSSGYVRNKKKKEKGEGKQNKIDYSVVKPFCYAHFEIPLYKFPGVTLLTIFFPLWLLGILNLGIFFQSVGLADRIGSLSGLLIAFVALIPVIRSELPQSPDVALVQILVYIQAYATILCFIESVNVRNYKQYDFVWYQNGFFMVSLIIELAEMVIITLILFIHKCFWERSYNQSESKKDVRFNFKKWENVKCDQHFRRKLDNRLITVTKVDQKLQKRKQHLMKVLQEEQKMQEQEEEEEQQNKQIQQAK